ncbi:MAG: type I DNA topoisomerase [Planctomycetes bacterium]|nr:type I DNA topoisomerase [Planctomycetota bacterium]
MPRKKKEVNVGDSKDDVKKEEPPVKPEENDTKTVKLKGEKDKKKAELTLPAGPIKNLVIVESPAKCKTINKILGSDYHVTASMGHVRDLPVRPRGGDIGVNIEEGFVPTYKILNKKKDIVKELKFYAENSEMVLLASDPDREGESIAWHLVHALRLPAEKYQRVTFNEITKDAVLNAMKNPRQISDSLVNAQQARRIIDRIVGYKLSPLLWSKIATRLSAGRVQSVALKLIVDREREIIAFKPVEYWLIFAEFTVDGIKFETKLSKIDGETADINNGKEANKIAEELRKLPFKVAQVQAKERQDRPYSPFTTSLLQQRASTELGFTSKRTMMIAQRLYEGIELGEGPIGLITYMRTDSVRVSDIAMTQVRNFIKDSYPKPYLPDQPNIYKARAKLVQGAHECIRPTDPARSPESIKKYLAEEQYKLYDLIWRRFIASQMTPAVYNVTEVQIKAGRFDFNVRGRELKFDGYYKVYRAKEAEEEQQLPKMKEGSTLQTPTIKPQQKFTEPPPRYSEASLIKILERNGIGRPSTYVPTLTTLQSRGYVISEGRQLKPTELGILVTGALEKHMSNFINIQFTAKMEESLDKVEEGKQEWGKLLDEFYKGFRVELSKAEKNMEQLRDTVEGKCDKCGNDMIVNWSRNGKKTICKNETCGNQKFSPNNIVKDEFCINCAIEMVIKLGRFGKFLACVNYPNCKYTKTILRGDKIVKVPDGQMKDCPQCKSKMIVRYTRRGPFLGCPKYPECKGIDKLPKEWIVDIVRDSDKLVQEEAEEKEDPE